MQHTPVLIVGGSLVGLSAALFLSWRGVPTVVIEKHQGSSPHPRAIGFTERTLEYFRAVGLADDVPQVEAGTRLRRVRAESLSGRWHEELAWTPGEEGAFGEKSSPCRGAAIAQDKLEPILRAAALAQGADLRYGVEMLSFEQTPEGVMAQMLDRVTGEKYVLSVDYMIAADGADSPIREALGIQRQGVGHLRTLRSVLFRCEAAEVFLERGIQQFQIDNANISAFLTSYGDGRWVLMFENDRELSETERAEAVREVLGNEMPFEMLATGRWELAGRIAEYYHHGRVFLVGDAAHQLPPTRGGFGANTGIDDAYNLAWKLEWVLSGRSTSALLETYSEERQPIGWLRHQQTFARPDYASAVGDALKGETLYGNEAMELGQLLRSSAVIGAGPDLPPAAPPEVWAGQPGTRAPHVWVERAGATLSTIDLFTHQFALISEDARWRGAAQIVAADAGARLDTMLVGDDIHFPAAETFAKQFGLSADGASLIRPDGVVAWRSQAFDEQSGSRLRDAFRHVAALKGK